jgi:hypothetical protein
VVRDMFREGGYANCSKPQAVRNNGLPNFAAADPALVGFDGCTHSHDGSIDNMRRKGCETCHLRQAETQGPCGVEFASEASGPIIDVNICARGWMAPKKPPQSTPDFLHEGSPSRKLCVQIASSLWLFLLSHSHLSAPEKGVVSLTESLASQLPSITPDSIPRLRLSSTT